MILTIFQKTLKSYDNQNEMVVGKMKDEYKGIPIIKFVRLKLKLHFMLSDDGKESNTAKGINTAIELEEYYYWGYQHKLGQFQIF